MSLAELQSRLEATLPDAHMEVVSVPGYQAIKLALINEDFPIGPLPQTVMNAVIKDPAYWAFCWGSGIALARYLRRQRGIVSGLRVLDLGSGSGIVAIAACFSGARLVVACDTDPNACLAIAVNAEINNVAITTAGTASGHFDIALLGDVLYDPRNLDVLDETRTLADTVLVADSRVKQTPRGFCHIGSMSARTFPNLGEFDEFRTVQLFRWDRFTLA